MRAEEALARLREGNARFQAGEMRGCDVVARRAKVAARQAPFAAVLSCSDSRTPAELLFDAGLGELFVVRTAGQVLGEIGAASMMFAVRVLGVRLFVVLAHTDCGAVEAAVRVAAEAAEGPAVAHAGFEALLSRILPSARADEGAAAVDAAAARHACATAADLRARLAPEGLEGVEVMPAIYDLGSGEVRFLG